MSGHVPSDRLGEAAQNGGVDFLREAERRHVAGCEHCQSLYGGYRLSDRLLAAPWHDVKLPPNSVVQPTRLAALTDFVRGPHARSVAPAVAAIGIVLALAYLPGKNEKTSREAAARSELSHELAG